MIKEFIFWQKRINVMEDLRVLSNEDRLALLEELWTEWKGGVAGDSKQCPWVETS